jgi:hypothetical protein
VRVKRRGVLVVAVRDHVVRVRPPGRELEPRRVRSPGEAHEARSGLDSMVSAAASAAEAWTRESVRLTGENSGVGAGEGEESLVPRAYSRRAGMPSRSASASGLPVNGMESEVVGLP